jgi:hypothetical protein
LIRQRIRKVLSRKDLLNNDYDIIQPGSFYRTNLVRKVSYLNEDIKYCMDLDLWLRLLEQGNIYSYNERPLAAFRLWEESKTMTANNKFFIDIQKTLREHGTSLFSRNWTRLYWYRFKGTIKSMLWR